MKIHHHIKHGVFKLASLLKGKIRIALLLVSFVVITVFAVTYVFNKGFTQSQTPQQTLGAETLAALNLHPLAADEFAVVSKKVGNSSGKKVTRLLSLSNGGTYALTVDENTTQTLIEGSDKTVTYVKLSEDTEIHKKDEATSNTGNTGKQKGKVESDVYSKLQSKDATTNVLIQFNSPFDKYYDKGDTKEKRDTKKGQFESTKKNIATKFNGKSKLNKDLKIINGVSATVDSQTLSALENDPNVKKVELDQEAKITLDTSVAQIKANDASNNVDASGYPITGKGKTVAIIDTGVDYTHPDLGGCLGPTCKVIGGYDFVNNDSDPMDDNGHGTHVAATAAGKGLLNGVAPGANIIAYKVCDASGSCPVSNIISAIDYSIDPNRDGDPSDHVEVGSMSLGGSGNPDDSMSLAVDRATAAGVTYVIAAGNSGPTASTIQSPGTARTAITVAASCKTAQIGSNSYCSGPIASFSSRGPLIWNGVDLQKPDVAAPGVLICAARWGTAFAGSPTCFDNNHIRISGTSMATPHVAGAALLILQAHPEFTPAQVKQLLKSTTHTLNMSYNDQGAGEIDVKSALPFSSKITSSPANWTITSDPTKKNSVFTQQFTISSTDSSVSSLSASVVSTVAGISGTVSKDTLQVANGATDSFSSTVTIDNDVANAGTYVVQLIFKDNGVIKGNIPIFVTVKPSFIVSPASVVDYGVDDPSLSSWTSGTQTYTLSNLRTDVAKTVQISPSGFPAGVTLSSSSSITIPANSTQSASVKLLVDNTKVSNGVYNGGILFTAGGTNITASSKFTKFYVLTVQDPTPANLASAGWVVVHDRNGNVMYDTTGASPRVFYLNNPGVYDVVVWYINVVMPKQSNYQLSHFVFKEGVNVTGGGGTVVNTSINDAQNLVRIVPTDSTGGTPQLYGHQQKIVYLPHSSPWIAYLFSSGGQQQQINDVYFSNVSSNYHYSRFETEVQPTTKSHYFYVDFTGLSASKTVTNTPSDFKVAQVQWNVDQQGGTIQPLIQAGLGGAFGTTYQNATFLAQPVTEAIYSLIPSSAGYFVGTMSRTAPNYGYTFDGDVTSAFNADTLHRMTVSFNNPLPDRSEATVYAGLGPTVWFGKFQNNSSYVALRTYFDNRQFGRNDTPFLRQDYSSKPVAGVPFTINKGTATVYSGTIPAFPFGNVLGDTYVGTAGVYEFDTTVPYTAKGLAMNGKVRAIFDTSKADPNPPAIKRLYYYTNSVRSEIYDPNAQNKVEVDLDPVGGMLTNVILSFSTDGQNFQPLTTTNNGSVYSAMLPATGTGKVTIGIDAKDDTNNELNYTFELPQGLSSAPLPSITPTAIPTPTPTATPTSTPTPLPKFTPTPTPDLIGPIISFTNPVNGSAVTHNTTVTMTVSASDPSGVAKVVYYVNGSTKAQCTKTTAPYVCNWKVPAKLGVTYQLQAKGYDKLGNISISTISVSSF